MRINRIRVKLAEEPTGHHIVAYCDGSCSSIDRLGGWGYVFHDKLDMFENWGSGFDTTSSLMELEAAIRCMEHLIDEGFTARPILIASDSQYVAFGAGQEREWERRRWDKVKNVPTWQTFFEHQRHFEHITFAWVKGHRGHYWNEYVDKLAGKGRKRALDKTAERLGRHSYGNRE